MEKSQNYYDSKKEGMSKDLDKCEQYKWFNGLKRHEHRALLVCYVKNKISNILKEIQ